jgi:hypothetical protein
MAVSAGLRPVDRQHSDAARIAETTLDTYGHLRPGKDESTKAVIDAVVGAKSGDRADSARGAL